MKKMIVYTSSFFNKAGNQSMLESIREYSKHYEITILTSAAESNDFYLKSSEAESYLPNNVKIYRSSNKLKNFLKKLLKPIYSKSTEVHKIDKALINQKYNRFSLLSQLFVTAELVIKSFYLTTIKKEKYPDIIVAYEIGGIKASLIIKRVLNFLGEKTILVSRLQGTTLYNAIGDKKLLNSYSYCLDHYNYKSLKFFDLNIMTNDGTNGDKVLSYYGVTPEKVLHLTNGIPVSMVSYAKSYSRKLNLHHDKIILSSVCRLVGWKRVYLTIEIMNLLVNTHNLRHFILNIYGVGNHQEVACLEHLITLYKLKDFVSLHGGVTHDKVPMIFDSSDFLISLYVLTNLTNPLLEALYLRCPLITIKDDSLAQVLTNEELDGSLILNEQSEKQIILDIVSFLTSLDPEKAKFRRCQGFPKVGNIYTWEQRINTEIKSIEVLLGNL